MAIQEGESAILRPPSSQNPVLVYDNPLLDPPKDGKINFEFSPFEMRNSAPFGKLLNFELFNQQSRIGLFNDQLNDQLNLEFVNDRRNLASVPDLILDWAISPAQF
ncbi:hypothetical protein E2P75_01690 [Limosilactobacillus fermentum]|nr:hypothetical protein E2P75_01690 [Limosilactobacillus fermentum]